MRRLAIAVSGAVACAACAAEPDGLLVVTGPGVVDPSVPATVDVFVGVDHGLTMVPLTETRAFVVNALPDDLDRSWPDPSQPYTVMLEPGALSRELYVVLAIAQGDRSVGSANLRHTVTYPGAGLYEVIADVHHGAIGVCPYGRAEDDGYTVEILPAAPATADAFDCDQDRAVYPQDCADYDSTLRPSPAYPASSGLDQPDQTLCCNGPALAPAEVQISSSGPGNCTVAFACPGATPFLPPRPIGWVVQGPTDGEPYCDCVDQRGRDPLDCLAGAHARGLLDAVVPQPFCDLAVDEQGAACRDQVLSVRVALRDFLPSAATTCPVSIWFQAGPVAISLRSQGSAVETQATDDCDADLVFTATEPEPGPTAPGGAMGWYILELGTAGDPTSKRVPMHVHAQPIVGCDQATRCDYE